VQRGERFPGELEGLGSKSVQSLIALGHFHTPVKLDPSTQQIDFKNRRALATGAGKGIGREIAVMLHRFNAQVVAVSRTRSDLERLRDEIGCETVVADLGSVDEARRAAQQAGDIDLLVNNQQRRRRDLEPFLGLALRVDGGFWAT
jgi:D-arabinose 1-dehydrogenase-like Zn-dependent alcohol dehydrogenase